MLFKQDAQFIAEPDLLFKKGSEIAIILAALLLRKVSSSCLVLPDFEKGNRHKS
jgi:hypothetical protein